MNNFDNTKLLPQNLVIKQLDNHLYRIGLCLTPVSNNKKRNLINNPILIFIFLCITLTKFMLGIIIPQQNELLLRVCGDFAHFMGVKTHYNIGASLFALSVLSTQITYENRNFKSTCKILYKYIY